MRYLIGERGPEMFVPQTDGTIIPNDVLTGKAVGQTMNVTQNIYSTDPMLTASEVVRKQRDAAFMAGV
jgi:phage-related minor tail protein